MIADITIEPAQTGKLPSFQSLDSRRPFSITIAAQAAGRCATREEVTSMIPEHECMAIPLERPIKTSHGVMARQSQCSGHRSIRIIYAVFAPSHPWTMVRPCWLGERAHSGFAGLGSATRMRLDRMHPAGPGNGLPCSAYCGTYNIHMHAASGPHMAHARGCIGRGLGLPRSR
jgi:hypothetical protein